MRAVVLKADGLLEPEERDRPSPGAGDCRVRIAAAGVCSSDIDRAFGGGAYHYPLVLGHELAGHVQGHPGLPDGAPVTVFPLLPCFSCAPCEAGEYPRCTDYDYLGSRRDGGFAESLCVPAWNVLPLPRGVGLEDGALTEPTAVVCHALQRLQVEPGQRVAVLGAGFLGQLAARMVSGQTVLVGRNRSKLARAAGLDGCEPVEVVDDAALESWCAEREGTFDRVLEAAGSPATFAAATHLAAPGGRVVWMGNIDGDLRLSRGSVSRVLRKELTLVGTWNSSFAGRQDSDWTRALGLMEGGLSPSALVDLELGFDDLGPGLRRMADHKARRQHFPVMKALFRP